MRVAFGWRIGLRRRVRAGGRRFRAILLTSLTTFVGLMPMLTETDVQGRFLVPMAVSLGFGLLFATGITLYLVPASYLVLEEFLGLLRRAWAWYRRPFAREEETEPGEEAAI